MQKVLYRDDPYVVLWYNVNLQAYRTDRVDRVRSWRPSGDGAPVLEPAARHLRRAAAAAAGARAQPPAPPRAWVWALVVAVAAVGAVAFALLRRRRKALEDA